MHLYKTTEGFLLEHKNEFCFIDEGLSWDELVNQDFLRNFLLDKWEISKKNPYLESLLTESLNPPIESQEVWAAGVTYYSSRLARMEESEDTGGGDFYSRVYQADRPEIFLKATPSRVVGHKQAFRVRQDSTWNVPEPELTLFATSSGKIVAYTVGNDVSSRSIEGENPLYLPQAKTFDKCACLGPGLYVPKEPLSLESYICMNIMRSGRKLFTGQTILSQMKRTPDELIDFLFRETSFKKGVFLMTGTGIVPGNEFSLEKDDVVSISIDLIGNLVNSVE